jgi:hypothetical protein
VTDDKTDRTPWVCIRISLPDSHKATRLRSELNLNSLNEAVGVVVDLFCKTYIHAWRDGDLTKWAPEDVERWLHWEGEPGKLVAALQKVGFLDGMKVHEWTEHQRRNIYNRQYMSNYRHRLRGEPSGTQQAPAPAGEEDPNAMRRRTKKLTEKP